MAISPAPPEGSSNKLVLILSAWGLALLISDLPDIIVTAITGQIPGWFFWGKIGLLGVSLGICLLGRQLRALWQFVYVMLVFFLALELTGRIRAGSWWQAAFNHENISFGMGFLGIYILDTAVALIVLLTLWLIFRDRKAFFLVKGQLDAPIEPVRWLGINKGESWKSFGWIFAVSAAVIVAIPTILSLRPSGEVLLRAASLLPVVFLCAAVNAFNEESYFRLSMLSTLPGVIGKTNILLITIVFFGLNHWLYGSPGGIVGFLMTGFLAFLMGKSILETKGLFWAWFIHFLSDFVVFASYAIAWFQ